MNTDKSIIFFILFQLKFSVKLGSLKWPILVPAWNHFLANQHSETQSFIRDLADFIKLLSEQKCRFWAQMQALSQSRLVSGFQHSNAGRVYPLCKCFPAQFEKKNALFDLHCCPEEQKKNNRYFDNLKIQFSWQAIEK